MNKINVGILGFGTVGKGAAKVLMDLSEQISIRNDLQICISKICDLNGPKKTDTPNDQKLFTKNADDLLNDPNIHIVVELIGGTGFAKDFIVKALNSGKHVVTANKHLLALYGNELFTLAARNNLMLFCEASVCGAIPCLRTLRRGVSSGKITSVRGIFNGTANYILSKLQHKGGKYQEVLKEAQDLGYAEADPTFDVEGIDAAHKVAILSAFAFGAEINYKSVSIQGISDLIPEDFWMAAELGYKIKLIGAVELINQEIFMSVRPMLVHRFSRLGQVDNALNAIVIEDDFSGPILLEGFGAGGLATGTAVVSDIVEIANHLVKGQISRSLPFKSLQAYHHGDFAQVKTKTMFRIVVQDSVGILAKVAQAFADENVSIDAVYQKPYNSKIIPVLLILEESPLGSIEKAAVKISKMPFMKSAPVIFPIDPRK